MLDYYNLNLNLLLYIYNMVMTRGLGSGASGLERPGMIGIEIRELIVA